jgi:uncharacterized membrane protein
MYPVRTSRPKSAKAEQLQVVAAKRQSLWLANVLSWFAGLLGCLSVFVLVAGVRQGFRLSTAPRPNIGPGFSESATAVFGSMLIGGAIAVISLAVLLVALLHSRNRPRTLVYSIPALLFIPLWLTASHWSH